MAEKSREIYATGWLGNDGQGEINSPHIFRYIWKIGYIIKVHQTIWVSGTARVHDFYMDDETIDIAEKELLEAKKRIQNKNKNYDYALAQKWRDNTVLSEKLLVDIPKYFVGTKLAWYEAMVGLNVAKILVRNDKSAMANVNEYTEKIIDYLNNKNLSKKKYAYRDNFEIPEPTPNLNILLAKEDYDFYILDNVSILCENEKETFIIIVPSSYTFYVNENTKVKHKLIFDDKEEIEKELPIWNSMIFIKEFWECPAEFFLKNWKIICEPENSMLYDYWIHFSEKINNLIKKSKTTIGRIELAYSGFADQNILNALKKVSKDTIQLVVTYNSLLGIEELAKLAGFDVNAEIWSFNRLAIAEVMIRILTPLTEALKGEKDEDLHKIREKIEGKPVHSTLKNKLENDVKELTEETNQLLNLLQDNSLIELQKLNYELQLILKSGLPVEEINYSLKRYYSSLR